MKGRVLYIGGFIMPDGNAAALRVLNIARILRTAGYETLFCGIGEGGDTRDFSSPKVFDGFQSVNVFESKKSRALLRLFDISFVKEALDRYKDICAVIAYNYPSAALKKVAKLCKKRGIAVLADCTEWYYYDSGNIARRLLRNYDSNNRMRKIHPKLDGIIAISSFLFDYYKNQLPVFQMPPTVNPSEYVLKEQKPQNKIPLLVYAGQPSLRKERLGELVTAVSEIRGECPCELKIAGITQKKFKSVYGDKNTNGCEFLGRIAQSECKKLVYKADYSVVIRKPAVDTKAGFPTKFVESVSLGTPVIVTDCGDVTQYVTSGETNGYIVNLDSLAEDIKNLLSLKKPCVKRNCFDNSHWEKGLCEFFEEVLNKSRR